MLQKIKQELREIKDGVPGRRFVDHYQRNRNKKSARIKPFAMLLDRLEVWGQKIRKRYRSKR